MSHSLTTIALGISIGIVLSVFIPIFIAVALIILVLYFAGCAVYLAWLIAAEIINRVWNLVYQGDNDA